MGPIRPSVSHLHIMRHHHSSYHQGYSQQLTHPSHPSSSQHPVSHLYEKVIFQFYILCIVFKFLPNLDVFHMEQTQKKSEKIWGTSDPRLDVNVSEVLLPFDKVDEMGDLLDLSLNDFIDVEAKPDAHHEKDTGKPCDPIFGVEEDKDHGEDEYLHVILKIPTPRHAHILTVIDEIVHK
jgi:hypothetical protein